MTASSRTSQSRWIQKPSSSGRPRRSSAVPAASSGRAAEGPRRSMTAMAVSSMRRLPASFGLLRVAAADMDDILVPDQRSPPVEVRDDAGTPSGGQREVHRRRFAVGLGLGLVEVGVTVDEQQSVTTAAAEREQVAEQDRAVATEHDRELADGRAPRRWPRPGGGRSPAGRPGSAGRWRCRGSGRTGAGSRRRRGARRAQRRARRRAVPRGRRSTPPGNRPEDRRRLDDREVDHRSDVPPRGGARVG